MDIKNTNKTDMTIREVTFKAGSVVRVTNDDLAQKVLGIAGFIVAPRKARKNAKNDT